MVERRVPREAEACCQTRAMNPKLQFLAYLGSALCFLVAALGGTRRGKAAQPAVLVPLGLMLFVVPTLWASYLRAF